MPTVQSTPASPARDRDARRRAAPLYAAGFTTAFGAHAVAANLGVYTGTRGGSLLTLGILLALYDGAEVILKPVFGALADRVGGKPVLLGGLLAFAAASGGFLLAGSPAALFAARLGQGAAAAAFSPAASMLVARLAPKGTSGRAFGSYGAWKGLGYTLGPLLGSALVALDGYSLLFAVLAALALTVAGWAWRTVPSAPPLPKARSTAMDLARRLSAPAFLGPTAALAGATAALSVGVGFLPVLGHRAGLGPLATGAAVSLLAATAALIQPRAGRAHDTGRLATRAGLGAGLAACASGLALAAFLPGLPGLLSAAVTIGAGTALITPLGFATLAASAPPERLGATMGAAEVGRELGDAGGPLLVGLIAAATLTGGLATLAALLALGAAITAAASRNRPQDPGTPQ
jgi:DHA1 family tetracycline resistance protein-like MFS transporter